MKIKGIDNITINDAINENLFSFTKILVQKKYDNMEKGKDKASADKKIRTALGKGPNDIITKDDQKKGMARLKDPEGEAKKDKEIQKQKMQRTRRLRRYEVI